MHCRGLSGESANVAGVENTIVRVLQRTIDERGSNVGNIAVGPSQLVRGCIMVGTSTLAPRRETAQPCIKRLTMSAGVMQFGKYLRLSIKEFTFGRGSSREGRKEALTLEGTEENKPQIKRTDDHRFSSREKRFVISDPRGSPEACHD